jgi:hypothetical protein
VQHPTSCLIASLDLGRLGAQRYAGLGEAVPGEQQFLHPPPIPAPLLDLCRSCAGRREQPHRCTLREFDRYVTVDTVKAQVNIAHVLGFVPKEGHLC